VIREIVRQLQVWDTDSCAFVMLEPGAVLSDCRIRRNPFAGADSGTETYVMEFRAADHKCTCPLFAFQPRTQTMDSNRDSNPARETL
jgi:hypothetical protein